MHSRRSLLAVARLVSHAVGYMTSRCVLDGATHRFTNVGRGMRDPKLLRFEVTISIPMKALPSPPVPLESAEHGPQLIADDVCPCPECCQDARPVPLTPPANYGMLLVALSPGGREGHARHDLPRCMSHGSVGQLDRRLALCRPRHFRNSRAKICEVASDPFGAHVGQGGERSRSHRTLCIGPTSDLHGPSVGSRRDDPVARNDRCTRRLAPFAAALMLKIQEEERLLVRYFGEAYRSYQAEVPAILPNFRLR